MTMSTSNANATYAPTLMRSTLTAVYPDRAKARHVINDLRAFGLRRDQLSVAMRDRRLQDNLVADTGLHVSEGAATGIAARQPRRGLRGFIAGLRANVFPSHLSI